MPYWLMRAGNDGEAIDFCVQHQAVAMDWALDDLELLPDDREAFKAEYQGKYPNDALPTVRQNAGTCYRFVYKLQLGDYILLAPKVASRNRQLYLGQIEGTYAFHPHPHPDPKLKDFKHQRQVMWVPPFPRTAFSQEFIAWIDHQKQTLTRVAKKEHLAELQAKLNT